MKIYKINPRENSIIEMEVSESTNMSCLIGCYKNFESAKKELIDQKQENIDRLAVQIVLAKDDLRKIKRLRK
jgi:hypothetical protein